MNFKQSSMRAILTFASLSETWLTPESVDYFEMNGFSHLHKCRNHKRGGGVSIYIKEQMSPRPVPDIHVPEDIEVVWGQIRPRRLPREISSIFVASVYFPPNSVNELELADHLIGSVDQLRSKHPSAGFIIMGDFNQMNTDVICTSTSLKQIVKKPTRNTAILDKILTNMKDFYSEADIMLPLGLSDHNSVEWGPLNIFPHKRIVFSRRVIRPMRDSDIRSFGRWISVQTWPEVQDAVTTSDKCEAFYTSFQSAIDTHFPTKEVKIHQKDKPWVTPSIKASI